MDFEKLADLFASAVHALASRLPKLSRRSRLALAIALPSILLALPGFIHIAKTTIERGKKDKTATATTSEPQLQPIKQIAEGEARPVLLYFGPNNTGNPQVHTGDFKTFEVNPIIIKPAKHERVYQLESSGPNHPILMSETMVENNFIQGFANLRDVFSGKSPEPEKVWEDMIGKQIKLDYHTEVEELPANLECEISQIPKDRRFVARLAAQSLAKVRILNGRYKGKIGWIYRPLMVETRLPVLDQP